MRPPNPLLRLRSPSGPRLDSVPPPPTSPTYSPQLAALAARIVYRSPLPISIPDSPFAPAAISPSSPHSSSGNGLPLYVLNTGALPDAREVDYDHLLPYVLTRLPEEGELIGGQGWECVVFAGGWSTGDAPRNKMTKCDDEADSPGSGREEAERGKRKNSATTGSANSSGAGSSRPGWGWYIQAYHLLSRAMRKRLRRLYIVHERAWIRVLVEMFAAVASPKFRKKVVHCGSLASLGEWLRVEDVLVPPGVWELDRKGKGKEEKRENMRGFGVREPLMDGGTRLPRCLREATCFLLLEEVVRIQGLFRVNPRKVAVEALRESYTRGQKFVIWRDRGTVLCFPSFQEGYGDVEVEELDMMDGFEAHTAAGLIKTWYRELKEPIFPTDCYQALVKFYGNLEEPLGAERLVEMLRLDSDWTILSMTARKILTTHLLPLLHRVAECMDWNQMTPYNLAVCFAPALLRGPDPVEDAKMSSLVRRVIMEMVTHWKEDLAPALGIDDHSFEDALQLPKRIEDREDPLENNASNTTLKGVAQMNGILLIDNDTSNHDAEEQPPPLPPRIPELPPPLPPRPQHAATFPGSSEGGGEVKRKPAPAVHPLPRYSMIVRERPAQLQQRTFYNTIEPMDDSLPGYADTSLAEEPESLEEPEAEVRTLPGYTPVSSTENTVPRKPVPSPKGERKPP
ncbi:MAG: hypothetical protein Q9190_001008 [Brigantiaea leucoxantha]